MSLRQFTSSGWKSCLVGLAMLVMAGCASGPKPAEEGQAGPVGADGQAAMVRDVPPEALTLYEQAVASMAQGTT